ncbi:MAG: hypothetical protein EZS28_015227 [Streblomastix strix]|uniref:Uncharacterized protein n=1 Tax=Streblomastix strix TaxID=222440 RepID=A0A5J4W3U6_9EUKA|nr:MAG: hypothetical protein EZS28_015227 [Streblomastix strix]
MSKNSIKPEPSEPGLFVNFDSPKFTTKTPVATAIEKPEMGDEIGKFLQSELQPTLQDIERQLTPRQAVSERTQMLMAKVSEAMTGVQASEIDFWATNILDEQNGEARRREIQCPSLLAITTVHSEQALALYNFRICEGILAHLCEQQQVQKAERTHVVRSRNENRTNTNCFHIAANTIKSYLSSQSGSHMLRAQVIAKSDTASKNTKRITIFLFGIQQLGKARVKTKRFRQLTPSTIQKQIMRSMLNKNENQDLEQNQEAQIAASHNDMTPPNSGPRGQPPPGQSPT